MGGLSGEGAAQVTCSPRFQVSQTTVHIPALPRHACSCPWFPDSLPASASPTACQGSFSALASLFLSTPEMKGVQRLCCCGDPWAEQLALPWALGEGSRGLPPLHISWTFLQGEGPGCTVETPVASGGTSPPSGLTCLSVQGRPHSHSILLTFLYSRIKVALARVF